jgi:predicted phage tail protein
MCPASLRETSSAVYAWDAATEEKDVAVEEWDPEVGGVKVPGTVTLLSDASTAIISGGSTLARVRFSFPPSLSSSVISYEWQYKRDADLWQTGGLIDAEMLDGGGDVFGFLFPVVVGATYRVRARAVSPVGASEWVESSPIVASAGPYTAGPPSPVSAIGGSGQIAVTFKAPNAPSYRAMEIWVATVNNSGAASLLFGPIYGPANDTKTEIQTGLGSGATRYYFGRSIDQNGNPSPFSASISATTTT